MSEHSADAPVRRRLCVTGRVQGVFFRRWMTEQARGLGIAGWVRNRADGSVEAVVEGTAEQVEALVARAHEGPAAARVDRVAVSDEGRAERLEGFATRPSA